MEKDGMKDELKDGGWSNYMPNDEWKCLELEKDNPKQANEECISEYGIMIDHNDFEYMCDHLLSNDAPFFLNYTNERLEEIRFKLVGTPHERIARMEQEFDDWARSKGYIKDRE
ncbi:hypothetical protein Tco_1207455 [Tanacetum coccineum]